MLVLWQIYALETAYLEDTGVVGNVVTGFEQYARSGHLRAQPTRPPVADSDRIFSLSSTTSKNATPLIDDGGDL